MHKELVFNADVRVGVWEGRVWLEIWLKRCEIVMGSFVASYVKLSFTRKVFDVGIVVLVSFYVV